MASSAALITAAGSSSRMGGRRKKEYLPLDGKPVLLHSLEAFEKTGLFSLYAVTVPAGGEEEARHILAPWLRDPARAAATRIVAGGDSRQKSVYNGLAVLEADSPDIVLIHDGARPWVSPGLIEAVHRAAAAHGACLPLVPSVDALKTTDENGLITGHPERSSTSGAQTPQGFRYRDILSAHRKALGDGREYVDDTEIYDAYAGRVHSVPGSGTNKKITYPEDLAAPAAGAAARTPRIGFGYDLHRLVEGRKLLLGGVHIPAPFGEDGHSDGDVLIHAVIDALLGAARLGDIGLHFPPSDPKYKDTSSRVLLRKTAELVRDAGFSVGNLDCTVVLERPKILPWREAIIAALAEDLETSPGAISVKGKTKERVDAVGEGRAVEAYASVLLA